MRAIDCLPQQRIMDHIREWLGLPLSAYELERRRVIAKDWGWPPVKYHGLKPIPTPGPPRKQL